MGGGLPASTQVLTSIGWKEMYNITTEDRVAQLDTLDGTLSYTTPLKVSTYPVFRGDDMVRVKGDGVNFLCASDHPVVMNVDDGTVEVKFKRVRARELGQPDLEMYRVAKACPGGFAHHKNKNKNKNKNAIDEEEEARIVLACFAHRHHDIVRPCTVRILPRAFLGGSGIHKREGQAKPLEVWIRAAGIIEELEELEELPDGCVDIADPLLYEMVVEMRKMTTFPQWLFEARPEVIRFVITDIFLKRENILPRCFADAIQQLAIHARDMCVDISYDTVDFGKRSARCEAIICTPPPPPPHHQGSSRTAVVAEPFSGYAVYCIEMRRQGSAYYIRGESGNVCWVF